MRESHRLRVCFPRMATQFDLPWPRSSKLGKYTFKLAIPSGKEASAILGTCTANLEEFTAAKLEVSIKPEGDVNSLSPGDNLRFKIAAQHLIGRPGEDLQAVHLPLPSQSFKPEDWDDFIFEDREKSFQPRTQTSSHWKDKARCTRPRNTWYFYPQYPTT